MLAHFFSPEPTFTLTIEPILNPQMTAEPTELACHVTNITHLPLGGRLGVTWEHTALPGTFISAFCQNIESLNTGNDYKTPYSFVLLCPITRRYRGWSTDLTCHWLPGQPRQPVARIDVFWQAEERRVVSEQSPAQHVQTAIPPHTGSCVDLLKHDSFMTQMNYIIIISL